MMYLVAKFQRGHEPSPTNAESDHSRSTRLEVWAHVTDGPQPPGRPSVSWLVCRPDSRHVELQRLLATH